MFFWAHPRAASARTGLSACIFFACGKKGYRSNPLRVPQWGILLLFILPQSRRSIAFISRLVNLLNLFDFFDLAVKFGNKTYNRSAKQS
jgi:hypothetical protein